MTKKSTKKTFRMNGWIYTYNESMTSNWGWPEGFTGERVRILKKQMQQLLKERDAFYRVPDKLITELETKSPSSVEEFLQIVADAEEGSLQGLVFADDKISLQFLYTTEPDKLRAYMQLTELMGKMAREQVRVKPAKCKETNEKYTFRVWLMRLGMMGDEYKTTRKILLQNLKGHAAFRTKDQADAAKEKLRAQRAAEKEAAREMAFVEL